MALVPVASFLRRHRRVALDTSVFIYQLASHPLYADVTDYVFAWIGRPDHNAVTSTITMTEFVVHPYRSSDEEQIHLIYALFDMFPNLNWIAPSLAIADTAGRLRARHNLGTPDAIHAATAIHAGATGLITNDSAFSRVSGFETFLLDDAVK